MAGKFKLPPGGAKQNPLTFMKPFATFRYRTLKIIREQIKKVNQNRPAKYKKKLTF